MRIEDLCALYLTQFTVVTGVGSVWITLGKNHAGEAAMLGPGKPRLIVSRQGVLPKTRSRDDILLEGKQKREVKKG